METSPPAAVAAATAAAGVLLKKKGEGQDKVAVKLLLLSIKDTVECVKVAQKSRNFIFNSNTILQRMSLKI